MQPAIVLAVMASLALPATAVLDFGTSASTAADEKPQKETVLIQLNLTGVATRTNGGPSDGYTAYINVTGLGTRQTPNGNGVQIKAQDLTADIVVVRNADGVDVENYTALVGFHAQQASCTAGGGAAGCFKFNLGLHGKRTDHVVANQDPDGRVLAMNAHGQTVGEPDEEGVFAMDAKGQSTSQPDGKGSGAQHFNIELAGTGSIMVHEGGDVPAPKAWVPMPPVVPQGGTPATPVDMALAHLR